MKTEGEGFEPSVPGSPAQRFSRPPHSTTLPPLRNRNDACRSPDPSGAPVSMDRVYLARLICSDADCAAEAAAEARTIRELESLICDCGCALTIIGWPDWVYPPAEVVALPAPRRELRDAA